jgi:translocation and assembly module TamB
VSVFRRFMYAGLLLASVLAAAFVFLGGTETGGRWLVYKAGGYFGIDVGTVSGSLLGGIRLEEIHCAEESQIRCTIENLSFRVPATGLLSATVAITSLQADGIFFELRDRPAPDRDAVRRPAEWPGYGIWPSVSIDNAILTNIRFVYGNGQPFVFQKFQIDAHIGPRRISLDSIEIVADRYRVLVGGQVAAAYPYTADLRANWEYAGGGELRLAGSGRIQGDVEALRFEHDMSAPYHIITEGKLLTGMSDGAPPRLELETRWKKVQLPLLQESFVSQGQIKVAGWLDGYSLSGGGNLESAALPPVAFRLSGGGDRDGFQLAELEADLLQGRLRAGGHLTWLPSPEWDLQLAADGLNPAEHWPDWSGNLGLRARWSGRNAAGRWQTRIDPLSFTGSLRGLSVIGGGTLDFDGKTWRSDGVRLALGQNTLKLHGSFNDRINVQWRIDAPRIGEFIPGAGQLHTHGRVSGKISSPIVDAELQAGGLQAGVHKLESLNATMRSTAAGRYELRADAKDVLVQGIPLRRLTINGRGTVADHELEIAVEHEHIQAELAAAGAYRNERWRGLLHRADWRPEFTALWSLREPVKIDAGEQLVIDEACWSSADAVLCASCRWNPDTGFDGAGRLDKIPLALLRPWLPRASAVTGSTSGSFAVNGAANDLDAELVLSTRDASVEIRHSDSDIERYPFALTRFSGKLRQNLLSLTMEATSGSTDSVYAEAAVNLQNRAIDGHIKANFSNLFLLEVATPRLRDVRGELDADLRIAGTLDQPLPAGEVGLRLASAIIPDLGLKIENAAVRVYAEDPGRLRIGARARSGPGHVEYKGYLAYTGGGWSLTGDLDGRDFQLLQLPQIEARVSPELRIIADTRRVAVNGRIVVGQAAVNIKTLPAAAISVSDDAVIVGREHTGNGNGTPPFVGRVEVVLSETVAFRAAGLDAGLRGQLVLAKEAGRPVQASGDLTVEKGVYRGHGQRLQIERGRLLFQGPYDNPGLDILAVRETPTVKASLHIGGTLKRPRSRIFSEPPLPDSEIMAILITGKPLAGASQADAGALLNAVAALGLERGEAITDEIAAAFGLDVLAINTASDVTQSSLTMGKYLTPRLLVNYVVGLFNETSRVEMNYKLTESLRLEAISGESNSLDLIYSIEK